MRANIKLRLFLLLPPALLALLDNVIKKITGNALFPTPPMTLAQLLGLHTELEQAIADAKGGSVYARKHRDNKVKEVRAALRAVADYVRSVSDGDAEKLASSGFELAKQPEPNNEVGVPPNVVVSSTDVQGTVVIRWGKTKGKRLFKPQQASGDPALGEVTWTTIALVSRQRVTVKGLTSYQPYWFRVIAIGADKEGFPSDVAMGRAA